MTTPESVLYWVAIVLYALSSAGFITGFVFTKLRPIDIGVWFASAGAAFQGASIALRWARTGHGPALGFFEVASGLAFLGVVAFLVLTWRYKGMKVVGVALMPITLFMVGATLLVNPDAQGATGSLASTWLAIHVLFANLAYGSYVGSFVLAVAYLMRDSGRGARWQSWLDRFPAQEELDGLTFRFVGAGFIFEGIMIASGAVWANEAWGRYWGWDPMETWSLIALLIYAVYLHLTITMGWRGRKAAWVIVIALPVIVFSLLGVPVFYHSIHGAYLST